MAFSRSHYKQVGSVCSEASSGGGFVSWTDANLPPGATYNYRIADVSDGKLLSRLFIQASTLLVPRPPSSVTGDYLAGDRPAIAVTWAAEPSDASGFRIERAPGRNGEPSFAEVAVVWADVTSYTDFGIASGEVYQYRVVAFNSLGDSAPSSTTTVATTSDR